MQLLPFNISRLQLGTTVEVLIVHDFIMHNSNFASVLAISRVQLQTDFWGNMHFKHDGKCRSAERFSIFSDFATRFKAGTSPAPLIVSYVVSQTACTCSWHEEYHCAASVWTITGMERFGYPQNADELNPPNIHCLENWKQASILTL